MKRTPSTTVAPSTLKSAPTKGAPALAKEKAKPVAFFNYAHFNPAGEKVFASSVGFRIYENEYQTATEKLLVKAARENGGSITLNMQVRVVCHDENKAEFDMSKLTLIK